MVPMYSDVGYGIINHDDLKKIRLTICPLLNINQIIN